MGLYPPGFNPNVVDHARIAAAMRPALYQWFNSRIQILDPRTSTSSAYNPLSDAGGAFVPAVLWDSGPNGALVEVIRAATGIEFGGQGSNVVGIRFQTKMEKALGAIRSGFQIRVLDGGEDPTLSQYLFAVREGFDGSFAWGRIIEATVVTSGVNPGSQAEVAGFGTGPYGTGGYSA